MPACTCNSNASKRTPSEQQLCTQLAFQAQNEADKKLKPHLYHINKLQKSLAEKQKRIPPRPRPHGSRPPTPRDEQAIRQYIEAIEWFNKEMREGNKQIRYAIDAMEREWVQNVQDAWRAFDRHWPGVEVKERVQTGKKDWGIRSVVIEKS